jgi:hypothetical protein
MNVALNRQQLYWNDLASIAGRTDFVLSGRADINTQDTSTAVISLWVQQN